MILSDTGIRSRLQWSDNFVISPYEDDNIEPASVDLRLGHDSKRVHRGDRGAISSGEELKYHTVSDDTFSIRPGEFFLASTMEHVELPNDLAARVLGRSTMGRLGLSVHQTAGYIDPGFTGNITLELSNVGPSPIKLSVGDRICQIVVEKLSSPAVEPYGHDGSHYQNQTGATPAESFK